MDIKMAVDKIFASIGDEINYTITITNQRNMPLKEVWITNELPIGMDFVEGSIAIDGYLVDGVINTGVLLGVLLEGESKQITYKCIVSRLPEVNPVINTADVYFVDVVGEPRKQVPSTAVVTVITDPNINAIAGTFELFVDKEVVSRQDILSYTVRLINQGNCRAERVYIKNLAPTHTLLNPESIRGIEHSVVDREKNLIYIEGLDLGEQITLTYDVRILPEMTQYEIQHQVMIEYEFVGPDRRRVYKQDFSHKALSIICVASFEEALGGFVKESDRDLYTIGDEILYTLKLTNNGNVTATHLRLIDGIPKGIDLIPESLMVEGSYYNFENTLEERIRLPDVKSYETIEVNYKGRVREEDFYQEKRISQAYITYAYVVGERFVTGENYSNVLEINVAIGLIDERAFQLVPDSSQVTLNDEVIYKMRLENRGNTNITPIHIVVDKPRGTSIIGKGWEERGDTAHFEYAPDLKPNEVIEIMYPLLIEETEALGEMKIECRLYYHYGIEDRLIEKNLYRVQEKPVSVVIASLKKEDGGIVKSGNQTCMSPGETVSYTTILTNTGNIEAQDVRLKRILTGYESVEDEEIIEVGSIKPNESKVITYDVVIEELPVLGYIGSMDKVEYSYEVGHQILRGLGESEEIITIVEEAYLSGEGGLVTQSVDKPVTTPGDLLTYTLALANRGNVVAKEIVVTLPSLEGGTWLGGDTILLEKIEVGEVYYFTYTLEVNEYPIVPLIVCHPEVDYVFYTNEQEKKYRNCQVIPIETPIYRAKLTAFDGELKGIVDKEYAALGDEVTCTIQLFNQGNRTAKGVCIKPQKVAGIDFGEEGNVPVLNLGEIKPLESIEVSYLVRIIDYQEEVVLLSELSYAYSLEEESHENQIVLREMIQTTPIIIKQAQLILDKWVDKLEVIAKDKIAYELMCKNKGNAEAVNVKIEIEIPKGMRLCQETMKIEGEGTLVDKQTIEIAKIRPEETIKMNFCLEIGEDIPRQAIIEKTKLNYEMQIDPQKPFRQVKVLPIETQFELIRPEVSVKILVEEKIGLVGEMLPCKMEITNAGNRAVRDVLIEIEMTEGVECIGYPVENMRIPLLDIGEMRTIDFKMHILTRNEAGKVVLSPYATYHYEMEGITRKKEVKLEGAELVVEEIKIEVNKKSDKDLIRVGVGDEINYRIQIMNTGTMSIDQLILYDELGPNASLVEGSLRINDELLNTAPIGYGINLGEMYIGQTLVVDYRVRVDHYYSKFIISKSYVEYAIRNREGGHYIKRKTDIDSHKIRMMPPCLATLIYNNTMTLPYDYLDIHKILDFKVEGLVINQSKENLHHIAIQGQLRYKIVYISIDKVKQSIEWIKLFAENIETVGELGEEEVALQVLIQKEYIGIINKRQLESRVEVGISES